MPELVAVVASQLAALLLELLLVDMDCNCTRTYFEVHTCVASSPHIRKKNLFHKLIRVIKMFNEKNFHGSVLSMKYFNVKLILNYGIM